MSGVIGVEGVEALLAKTCDRPLTLFMVKPVITCPFRVTWPVKSNQLNNSWTKSTNRSLVLQYLHSKIFLLLCHALLVWIFRQ